MTTAQYDNSKNLQNLLTPEELESVRLIINQFEMQVRIESAKHIYGGINKKQKEELCVELGKLQEIKRKLKLMKSA